MKVAVVFKWIVVVEMVNEGQWTFDRTLLGKITSSRIKMAIAALFDMFLVIDR